MAVNPGSVARALPPSGAGSSMGGPGGFGGVPSAIGSPNSAVVSPLVASYEQWTAGRPYGTGLPRIPDTFLSGAFGPLSPIAPIGIDKPQPDSGRPEPRRFPMPVAWNMPIGEPGTEAIRMAPFEALRTISDTYSVARACIELRKNEIIGLNWDIVPTREAQKSMRGSDKQHMKFAERRAEAIKFFKRPDPEKYHTFNAWLAAMLEDIFVIDALSVYLQPSRRRGKGLLGSDLAALCLIDGSSVRPLLDIRGGTPQPPAPAYQVYNYGVPRVDLMTAMTGDDVVEMGEDLAAEYRGDQLLYLPYTARDWTPYGLTPLEQALVPVLSGIQRQQYQLNYFAEGSVPGMFISAGNPDMTPNQLRELQDALNAMAGDPAWKHKIIVLPGNSKIDPMRPVPLADQFDEVIMNQVCMAYSVMPMELGIAPKVSTTMCYEEGTEILTKNGWKDFAKVETGPDGDLFATRNPDTHELEWQLASEYHEGDFSGEMVRLSSRDFDLKVTPNHRVLVQRQSGNQVKEFIREARELPVGKRVTIPATSGWTGSSPDTVKFGSYEWSATDFASFLGAWIAEGSLGRQINKLRSNGLQKQIRLTQKSTSKGFKPYRELLARMLGRECGYHEQSGAFFFNCAELWDYLNELGYSHTKYVPEDIKDWAPAELEALLHHYLLGDGWKDGDRWRASTVSRQLADDLQEIAQKLGGSASIVIEQPKRRVLADGRVIEAENCRPVHRIGFRSGASRVVTVSREKYSGKVRCVTVPNGIVLVRNPNAKVNTVCWSGNSPGAANQMSKASETVNQRKALRPLLKWLKASVFDFILQDVCGQPDMEWMWEGLEEGVDEASEVSILVQEVSFGFKSIDEARVQRGEQPWGLPLTSDPVFMTTRGITPIGSIDPQTGMALPAQADAPVGSIVPTTAAQNLQDQRQRERQQGQAGPTAPQAGSVGTHDNAPGVPVRPIAPAAGTPGPQTAPSGGKPPQEPSTAEPSTPEPEDEDLIGRDGSPGHQASGAGLISNKPRPQIKSAALRELDLIRRRLIKGHYLDDWTVEHIPARIWDQLNDDIEKEYPIDVAIDRARLLVKHGSHGDQTHEVYAYLARSYPSADIDWVKDAHWHEPVQVPLDQIQSGRRPGGAYDEVKVRQLVRAIEDGTPPEHPVVLVRTPSGGRLRIADGWHRVDAFRIAKQKTVKAWVGDVDSDSGMWGAAMNADSTHYEGPRK